MVDALLQRCQPAQLRLGLADGEMVRRARQGEAQIGKRTFKAGLRADDLSCQLVPKASLRVMRLCRMTDDGMRICRLL